jgi:hypothetical protein
MADVLCFRFHGTETVCSRCTEDQPFVVLSHPANAPSPTDEAMPAWGPPTPNPRGYHTAFERKETRDIDVVVDLNARRHGEHQATSSCT